MKSLFHPITENAIHPKIQPCRYTALFIPRNPRPSSRKDYCKSVAICHHALIHHSIPSSLPIIPTHHAHHILCATPATQATQPYYKHSTAHSMAMARRRKESLFCWRRDPRTPLPHAPQRASSQCGNPSPHKNSIFYLYASLSPLCFAPMQLRYVLCPMSYANVVWLSLIVFLVLKYKFECLNCIFYSHE